jgi:hypothetical protein
MSPPSATNVPSTSASAQLASVPLAVPALPLPLSTIVPSTPVISVSNTFINNLEGLPSSNYMDTYCQVPLQIPVLWNEGSYLPLTLFTNSAWRRMHTDSKDINYTKCPDPSGGKPKSFLKISQFGDKLTLPQGLWEEAWGNLGTFVSQYAGAHAMPRWRNHYNWIKSQADFHKSFPAYCRFDIQEQQAYIHVPCAYSADTYNLKFQNICLNILTDNLLADRALLVEHTKQPAPSHGHGGSSRPPSSHLSKPYDHTAFPRPFHLGTSSGNGISSCLICAQAGHRFQQCKSSKFSDNVPMFCKVSATSLVM